MTAVVQYEHFGKVGTGNDLRGKEEDGCCGSYEKWELAEHNSGRIKGKRDFCTGIPRDQTWPRGRDQVDTTHR